MRVAAHPPTTLPIRPSDCANYGRMRTRILTRNRNLVTRILKLCALLNENLNRAIK